jgi:hypothetical protein
MKKTVLLMSGIVLLVSSNFYGQDSKKYGIGINYNTENTLGLDFIYGNKYIVGGGVSFGLASYGVGEDYTDSAFTSSFSDQLLVSKDVDKKTLSVYGIGGYKFKKIKLIGKLGYGSQSTYYNYYDPSRIFGNNGYYFKLFETGGRVLIGANIGVEIIKNIYIDGGYDTFNGGSFGLTYVF